jgi:hypothetical protein
VASTRFTRIRSRIALRSRELPTDHPEILALREEPKGALVVQRIGLVLDKAKTPLTPELRAEIEQLLADRVTTTVAA